MSTHMSTSLTDCFGLYCTGALARVKTLAHGAPVILASTYTLVTPIRAAELGLAGVSTKPMELDRLEKVLLAALGEDDRERR